jgi:phosphohistidine phosphatase
MKLYLLRHGDAVETGDPKFKDAERPLTPKGIQRTKQLAHALQQMEISFEVVLSSPLTRANETAETVIRGLDFTGKLELTDSLSPFGSMENLVSQLNTLRPVPENVLLVGHEPYLSGFISLLCTGGPGLALTMKKGALCRLEVESPTCGKCATLEWLLPPRVLGLRPSRRKSG